MDEQARYLLAHLAVDQACRTAADSHARAHDLAVQADVVSIHRVRLVAEAKKLARQLEEEEWSRKAAEEELQYLSWRLRDEEAARKKAQDDAAKLSSEERVRRVFAEEQVRRLTAQRTSETQAAEARVAELQARLAALEASREGLQADAHWLSQRLDAETQRRDALEGESRALAARLVTEEAFRQAVEAHETRLAEEGTAAAVASVVSTSIAAALTAHEAAVLKEAARAAARRAAAAELLARLLDGPHTASVVQRVGRGRSCRAVVGEYARRRTAAVLTLQRLGNGFKGRRRAHFIRTFNPRRSLFSSVCGATNFHLDRAIGLVKLRQETSRKLMTSMEEERSALRHSMEQARGKWQSMYAATVHTPALPPLTREVKHQRMGRTPMFNRLMSRPTPTMSSSGSSGACISVATRSASRLDDAPLSATFPSPGSLLLTPVKLNMSASTQSMSNAKSPPPTYSRVHIKL